MKNLILVLSLLIATAVIAQDDNALEKSQFAAELLFPGISGEFKVSEKITIFGKLGLAFGYQDSSFQDEPNYAVSPQIQIQGRYFYNLDRRARKGKTLGNNNGNFIGILYREVFGDETLSASNENVSVINGRYYGAIYGLQRVYGEHWMLGFHAGIGVYDEDFINQEAFFGPLLNFRIGYVF